MTTPEGDGTPDLPKLLGITRGKVNQLHHARDQIAKWPESENSKVWLKQAEQDAVQAIEALMPMLTSLLVELEDE